MVLERGDPSLASVFSHRWLATLVVLRAGSPYPGPENVTLCIALL